MSDKRQIILCDSIEELSRKGMDAVSRERFRWLYLGKDTKKYFGLVEAMNKVCKEIPSGPLINKIAQKVSEEYVNKDQSITPETVATLAWQASSLAENNPYISDLFYQCCATLALEEILVSEVYDLIVICEDQEYILFLSEKWGDRQYFLTIGHNAEWLRIRGMIYRFLRKGMVWIYFLWRNYTKRLWLSMNRMLRKAPAIRKAHLNTLFVLWGTQRSFRSGEKLRQDSHFGELMVTFREAGQSLTYLVLPVDWIDPYASIVDNALSSDEDVLLPEDCLTVWDYCQVALEARKVETISLNTPLMIGGNDFSQLFYSHLRRERCRLAYLESVKYRRVGVGIGKRFMKLDRVVHLFENQPWEKTLRMGIRSRQAGIKILGCQHAPFPRLYLNYFASRRSIEMDLLPDQIISIGDVFQRVFQAHGYKSEQVKAGSAFRYAYLFSVKKSSPKSFKQVLIATSISYQESLELVYKVLSYFGNRTNYDVKIKFHPKLNRQDVLIREVLSMLGLRELPCHVQIVTDEIERLLETTGIVFYNFTAVCYEALVRMIPVVFIKSDIWLDMNKLEWFEEVNFNARTVQEIDQIMTNLSKLDTHGRSRWGRAARTVVEQSFTMPLRDDLVAVYN